jgi:ABC-type sugar transport system ATPase subunit
MPDVVFDKVSKLFPAGIAAVKDLSLHVHDGELVVLVGPSGCGKTTTLRLVAGLETPTSGTIRIGDRAMAGIPPAARNVGFVFQRPVLHPHRTVHGNLAFGPALRQRNSWWGSLLSARRRRDHEVLEEQVKATANLLGLTSELQRYPAELSGGQQQRVALGRALVRRPGVLLLDEPLSNLDSGLRQELRRQLHLLQRQLHVTMLYVTHDPVEAMTLGDRLAVMDRGQLQQIGTPDEVFRRPANRFVAGFVGWPTMNFLDGELQDHDGGLVFVACPGKLLVPAPEHVDIVDNAALDTLPMRVRLIEALGHSTLVTLGCGSVEITAWCQGGCPFSQHLDRMAAEKTAMVRLSMAKGHLFDRLTGAALVVRPTG